MKSFVKSEITLLGPCSYFLASRQKKEGPTVPSIKGIRPSPKKGGGGQQNSPCAGLRKVASVAPSAQTPRTPGVAGQEEAQGAVQPDPPGNIRARLDPWDAHPQMGVEQYSVRLRNDHGSRFPAFCEEGDLLCWFP